MSFFNIGVIFYFFVPVLLIYYLAPKNAKNAVLISASLIFGIISGRQYFAIPAAMTLINYIIGRLAGKKRSPAWLFASVIINTAAVVLLGIGINAEKFFFFSPRTLMFAASLMCALRAFDYHINLVKGSAAVQTSLPGFTLYMLYFPTFAAGPAVSYNDFRLMTEQRTHCGRVFLHGTLLFLCGAAKKVFLVDRFLTLWLIIHNSDYTVLSAANAWFGAAALILYAVLFMSSYWDCAVGLCKMTGFDIERIFHPIKRIKMTGAYTLLYLIPAAAAAFFAAGFVDAEALKSYADALMLKKGIGLNASDFLYRFCSSDILFTVGTIIALHIPSKIIRFVKYLAHGKEKTGKRDNIFTKIMAAAVIGVMVLAAAANTVYIIGYPAQREKSETNSLTDESYVKNIEKFFSDSSLFSETFRMINADVNYLMRISGMNGVYYADDNSLIECPPEYNEKNVDAVIEKADAISDKERYTTYIALIPSAYETRNNMLPPYAHDGRVKKTISRIYALLDGSSIELADLSEYLTDTGTRSCYHPTASMLNALGEYNIYHAMSFYMDYQPLRYEEFKFNAVIADYKGELMDRAGGHFTASDSYLAAEDVSVRMDGDIAVNSADTDTGRALALICTNAAPNVDRLFAKSFDTVYTININKDTEEIKEYLSDKYITDVLVVLSTDDAV